MNLFIPWNQTFLEQTRVITSLFLKRSPSTILLTVISIIVNSINGSFLLAKSFNMFQVRFVHIFSEVFKGLPSIYNASTTIAMPLMIVGILASSLKTGIDIVKSIWVSLSSKTMREINLSYIIPTAFTATGSSPSSTEVPSSNDSFIPTITLTKKGNIAPLVLPIRSKDNKFTESLSRKINPFHQSILI